MHVSTWGSHTKGKLAHVIAMFDSTKNTTLFEREHVLEFGFEIIELKKKGNLPVVTGVPSQDIKLANRKRKPIDNIHTFKAPFIK
jgi:hypothetical protein